MAKIIRGRFNKNLNPTVEKFVGCVEVDKHLAVQDVDGSIAHVKMLSKQKIIPAGSAEKIVTGLRKIRDEVAAGRFRLDPACEDIHMNVENSLRNIIGDDADYLHTARSRNDQVALDLVLFTVESAQKTGRDIRRLQKSIAKCGLKNIRAVMPSYTHLQRAQPVLFAHVLGSFVSALGRDKIKMSFIANGSSVSPLGACALTGTSLNIDPEYTARLAGLKGAFSNSVDAVTNRDYICDYIYAASMTCTHLSQIAETLIIWSSSEFGFISLPDDICTGSSIMPQKKNPDALELIRAKSAVAAGALSSALGILKALHVGYNRDLQETKPLLISTARAVTESLEIMRLTFDKLSVNSKRMAAAIDKSVYATDVAEAMVKEGMRFRSAYNAVANAVRNGGFEDLASKYGVEFDPYKSVSLKKSPGGTNPKEVERFLKEVIAND